MNNPVYDIAIIGGGINGAAIARDASLRGLKVILLEKEDFGNGASTKTSKLAHGGVRYLQNLEFGLVRSALRERSLLLQNAPGLVRRLPFIFPRYTGQRPALWMVKIGLSIYDLLNQKDAPTHENLEAEEVIKLFPDINRFDLVGGCLYWDAEMDDNRLVIETLLSAERSGAVIHNYSKVTEITHHNDLSEVTIEGTPPHHIKARSVVNATGAWSNQLLEKSPTRLRVYPSRGVHLVIPQVHPSYALILEAPQDRRLFFLIPWNGLSLLGTTDLPHSGNPDALTITQPEEDYLLEAFNAYFPTKQLERSDIISAFIGLRPLVKNRAVNNVSLISREHVIEISRNHVVTILGGKFTTHRQIAEEVVDQMIHQFKWNFPASSTSYTPLCDASKTQVKRAQPICSLHAHTEADVIHAIRVEKAQTLSDWYYRRTSIAYSECRGIPCVRTVAQIFARELNWKDSKKEREIRHYLDSLYPPVSTDIQTPLFTTISS